MAEVTRIQPIVCGAGLGSGASPCSGVASVRQSNSCSRETAAMLQQSSDYQLLRSTSKPHRADSVSSPPSGYDSGIGSSPHPPDTLVISKIPRSRRRKRQPSTNVDGFEDIYIRTGSVLGTGAFSQVERCRMKKTGQEFAVKIINKDNWYTRARALQEVEILCRGKGHPNIIQLEDFFEGKNQFYLIFEMMTGGALIDHIESHKRFTEREAAKVIKGVATALSHLHGQGIAHRDLKFENILCGENFTDVKICDFDLGGQRLDIPFISTPLMDSPVGSAEFMAPEVVSLFEGNKTPYDKSCDMWSLGVLLYIMVYGKPPFTGRCGLNCGWDNGEDCRQCQESLFHSIQQCNLTFDPNINVSLSVKELISNLLVKDSHKRLTADGVLEHYWIVNEGNDNLLPASLQLKRNKSSAINLGSISTQINQHYRRINSNSGVPQQEPEMDPIEKAMNDIDIGESWYEPSDDDDNGEDDETEDCVTMNGDGPEKKDREEGHFRAYSPPNNTSPVLSDTKQSPHTPTDHTPIQKQFIFPDNRKVEFYISSSDSE